MGHEGLARQFSSLQEKAPWQSEKQKLVISNIVLIHNFRTEIVGLNEINTVFDPEYEMYRSLTGYNRIRRFYFNEDDI